MFSFAHHHKGLCIDFGTQAILLALLGPDAPGLVVEELKEFGVADRQGLAAYLKTIAADASSGYVQGRCAIYPDRRLVRRHTIEPERYNDSTYLPELVAQQGRLEPDNYVIQIVNADDGGAYDPARAGAHEVLLCGLPAPDVEQAQDELLKLGFYPEQLEIGTVAVLGALSHYLRFQQMKSPVLLLELGLEFTGSYIVGPEGVDASKPLSTGIAAMIPVVQKELGLKDEAAARRLFYSNTFDFTSMGNALIKKLLKELQASIGLYEIQSGKTLGGVCTTQLPPALGWLGNNLAAALGVAPFSLDLPPWLDSLGIHLAAGVRATPPDERWLGLFSLLLDHSHAVAAPTTNRAG